MGIYRPFTAVAKKFRELWEQQGINLQSIKLFRKFNTRYRSVDYTKRKSIIIIARYLVVIQASKANQKNYREK